MSIEVKVSIEQGKSRIFLLEKEELTLEDLRKKIQEKRWEAVGSNFYFLKNGSEIDQEDEAGYQLSKFKQEDEFQVVVSDDKAEELKKAEKLKKTEEDQQKAEKLKKAEEDQQKAEKEQQNAEKDRKAKVKDSKESAKTALADQELPKPQLDPNEKPSWGKTPDRNLIKDEGIHTTSAEGIYSKGKWNQLEPHLESLRFPKALKLGSQGLESVNLPGVKLSKAISETDVENEVQISDKREAYYTEWEQQAYKLLSKSVSGSVGIPIPQLSVTLGLSASYETSSESLTQSKETRLFMVAQRLVQKTKVILKKETIQITEEFKQSVERAKNIAELRQVFQTYGYFVPTTYIIGGKILAEHTETFSGQAEKTAKVNKFGVGVTAELDKAGFTASASGAYKSEDQDKNSQSSALTASRYLMTLKGGDEALINNGTQWISSLTLDKWQIVGYEDLVPITDFLDETLKQKCEEILSIPTPWLEVQYVRLGRLVKEGDDSGSGASRDLTVYKPSVEPGWYWVGQYAQSDRNNPTGQTIILKPLKPDAVKPPTRFEQIWTDKNSGNSKDYSCWKPIPPIGYVALGHIMRLRKDDYNPPSGDEISGLVCVKSDLVSRATLAVYSIWDDKGTKASQDCSLWAIKPKPGNVNSAIDAGTFYGEPAKSDNRPQNLEAYCLKKDVVSVNRESGAKDQLSAGESLNPGEKLISSNQIFRLEYQKDGNLVIYKFDTPLWSTGTNGKPIEQTRFQDDGNLVMYDQNNHAIWEIGKYGSEYQGSQLIMQDDGNLVAYDKNGNSYWASGTTQYIT
jgi:hypothetical protein